MTTHHATTMRVNARLDDNAARKLGYLQERTGLSLSDVVRDSIEHYYAEVRDRAERDAEALDDLVGAFDGDDGTPEDLSSDYKRYLWMDEPAALPTTAEPTAGRTAE
jgi:predicted DNA-binding protein